MDGAAEGDVFGDEVGVVDFGEGGGEVVRGWPVDVEAGDHGGGGAGGEAVGVDGFEAGVGGEGDGAAEDTVDVWEDEVEGEGEGVARPHAVMVSMM